MECTLFLQLLKLGSTIHIVLSDSRLHTVIVSSLDENRAIRNSNSRSGSIFII